MFAGFFFDLIDKLIVAIFFIVVSIHNCLHNICTTKGIVKTCTITINIYINDILYKKAPIRVLLVVTASNILGWIKLD
jgi:hypothetical protein